MNHFKALVDWLKQAVTDQEQFHLGYADEASEFVRFNHARGDYGSEPFEHALEQRAHAGCGDETDERRMPRS